MTEDGTTPPNFARTRRARRSCSFPRSSALPAIAPRRAFGNSSSPTSATPHTRRAYGRAIGEFLAWCERQGARVDRRRAAAACRRLCRGAHPQPQRADRQAAPRRHPHAVRLAGDRPDRADQSRRERARAEACRQSRQDGRARSGRGADAHRQHRRVDAGRLARPRARSG